MLQIGKEKGYHLSDDQFKGWLENLRKEQNLQDDQKFKAALKQEGHDDRRPAQERRDASSSSARAADEVGSKLVDHRGRSAPVLPDAQDRVRRAADRHAARDPHRGAARRPRAAGRRQRGGRGRGGEEQAAAMRARIPAGEDFAKVAAEVSASPSKANGGLIGPINLSESLARRASADDQQDEARRDHAADSHEPRRSRS